MDKLIVNNYEEFEAAAGTLLESTEWMEIGQDRINKFADATNDHQWIHVDQERAKEESPYHTTIAHGYLTLSILPYLWQQIIQVNNISMMVNYGMDKMRFGQPVKSGDFVRLSATLKSVCNLRGITKVEVSFVLNIRDQKKFAVEGIATFLYYFKK